MNKETTRLTVRQYESVKIIFNPLKDVSKSLISLTNIGYLCKMWDRYVKIRVKLNE